MQHTLNKRNGYNHAKISQGYLEEEIEETIQENRRKPQNEFPKRPNERRRKNVGDPFPDSPLPWKR